MAHKGNRPSPIWQVATKHAKSELGIQERLAVEQKERVALETKFLKLQREYASNFSLGLAWRE